MKRKRREKVREEVIVRIKGKERVKRERLRGKVGEMVVVRVREREIVVIIVVGKVVVKKIERVEVKEKGERWRG